VLTLGGVCIAFANATLTGCGDTQFQESTVKKANLQKKSDPRTTSSADAGGKVSDERDVFSGAAGQSAVDAVADEDSRGPGGKPLSEGDALGAVDPLTGLPLPASDSGAVPGEGASGGVPPGSTSIVPLPADPGVPTTPPVPPVPPVPPTAPIVATPKPPANAQEVVNVCATGVKVKKAFTLSFASTENVTGSLCKWSSPPEVDGRQADDTIRGSYLQEQSVTLPESAVLCGSRLSTSEATLWRYDDEVVLTLNGVVLMTSQDRYLWRSPETRTQPIHTALGSGFVFDWAKLAALKQYNTGSTIDSIYCHGLPRGSASCELPLTQQTGSVKLSLPTQAVAEISLKANREKKLTYGLLVTGDNDPSIDCKHSGMVIQGEVEYVVPQ
jgi:hypothetical protein